MRPARRPGVAGHASAATQGPGPVASLAEVAPRRPEAGQPADDAQTGLDASALGLAASQRRTQIVVFRFQAIQPRALPCCVSCGSASATSRP